MDGLGPFYNNCGTRLGENDVPRAICLVKSYCPIVCGNKLERRRKEKKMKEYKAVNLTLCSTPVDVAMTFNLSILRA